MKFLFYVLFTLFSLSIVSAQETKTENKDGWIISGSAQFRSELDGRDFLNSTFAPIATSSRIRVGVEKTVFNDVTFFVQFQDSRVFGKEKNTLASLSNVDLHQADVTINNIFNMPLSVKVGRSEVSYGTNRFIGNNSWHYISRSFDGGKITYKSDKFWVDLYTYTISMFNDYLNVGPAGFPYPIPTDTSFTFHGFWSSFKLFDNTSLDLFGYYEWDKKKEEFDRKRLDTNFSGNRTVALNRMTAGFSYDMKLKPFSLLAEFGYQFGDYTNGLKANKKDSVIKYTDIDIGAYQLAVKAQYDFEPFSVSINAEIQTGIEGGDTAKSISKYTLYDNTYATKHALNGYMDYFGTLSSSTQNLGLNDYFIRLLYSPKGSPFYAQLDGHYFTTNQKNKDGNNALGPEIDLVLRYTIVKGVTFEWGGCIFLPGDAMKEVYKVKQGSSFMMREDPSFWSYLMIRAFL